MFYCMSDAARDVLTMRPSELRLCSTMLLCARGIRVLDFPASEPLMSDKQVWSYALIAVVAIALVIVLASLNLQPDVVTRTIARVSSPDATLDAVLFTKDVGATARTAYYIAIVPKAAEAGDADTVYIGDYISKDTVKMRWRGSLLLVTLPPGARAFRQETAIDVGGRTVQIGYESWTALHRLVPPCEPFSAECLQGCGITVDHANGLAF
jgi:hypothetical protein